MNERDGRTFHHRGDPQGQTRFFGRPLWPDRRSISRRLSVHIEGSGLVRGNVRFGQDGRKGNVVVTYPYGRHTLAPVHCRSWHLA
jgi:hypothetical protein